MLGKSSNKIHLTWGPPSSRVLFARLTVCGGILLASLGLRSAAESVDIIVAVSFISCSSSSDAVAAAISAAHQLVDTLVSSSISGLNSLNFEAPTNSLSRVDVSSISAVP